MNMPQTKHPKDVQLFIRTYIYIVIKMIIFVICLKIK